MEQPARDDLILSDYYRWCVDLPAGEYLVWFQFAVAEDYFCPDSHYRFGDLPREAEAERAFAVPSDGCRCVAGYQAPGLVCAWARCTSSQRAVSLQPFIRPIYVPQRLLPAGCADSGALLSIRERPCPVVPPRRFVA